MAKWSKAQHRKFRATVRAKRQGSSESLALTAFEARLAPPPGTAEPAVPISQMAEFVVALVDAARRKPQ